jgi:HEAT repeat protein
MNKLAIPLLVASLFSPACSKSDDKGGATDTPPPVNTKIAEVADPGAQPAAVAYSADVAAAAIAKLEACENEYSCEPLKTLVAFGDNVSKDLLAIAVDATKKSELRSIAAAALSKIKDPSVGVALFEAAKVEEDFSLRSDLFKGAGASGGDATFTAMIEYYASDDSDDHRTGMRSALRNFDGAKLFAYAVENYPSDKDKEVRFADLVNDAGESATKEKVVELIGKSKHMMARHRLANAAVTLGDVSQISVLIDGLKSDDQYDRSDAANFLQGVAEQIPADQKQAVIDLVTAAKKKDKGGLTSRGYDAVLKKLGAE